jgi:Outer membrane protein beta-barrel domain
LAKHKTMKYVYTFCLLLIAFASSAQIKKGDWNIGTSTNATMNLRLRTNDAGFKSYDFIINPSAGYFIKDRWEIGGGPLLSFSGAKFKDELGTIGYNTNKQSVGLNIYTRYYLKKEGKVIPYLTANAMYMHTNGYTNDFFGTKSTYKFNEWQVGAGAGVSWFIAPKAALFSEFTYTGNWGGGSGYTNGLKLNVGFQIYLNRKGKK